MSDSEEDLGFTLKGLKLSSKHVCDKDAGRNSDDEEMGLDEVPRDEDAVEVPVGDSEGAHVREEEGLAGLSDLPATDAVPEPLELPEEVVSEMGSDSDEDESWKNMEAIASYNVYNDKGELELRTYQAHTANTVSEEALSGTGSNSRTPNNTTFGYTKVAAEEQAHRSNRTNRKTDFLFDHKRLKRLNGSNPSTVGDLAASQTPSDDEKDRASYDEFEEDVEPMNDLNADSQLNVTKNLLDEMEKFAYVAAVNVLANQMCTELATTCLCVDIKSHRKLAQRLNFAQKDTAIWKTHVLASLYDHLQLSSEEVTMIEKLSMHGVHLEDLCKCLKTTQEIENPFEGLNESKQELNESKQSLTDSHKEDPKNGEAEVLENRSSKNNSSGDICDHNDTMPSKNGEVEFVSNTAPREVIAPENMNEKKQIRVDVAWTIICDLFLVLLHDAAYDARSRTLLLRFAEVLNIKNLEICEFERRVTDSLDMEQSTENQEWNEVDHMKSRRKKLKKKKLCYVGLAMVGGSLILGLSGGLLAPVIGAGIAAGLSTIGIGGAAGFLTGAGGTAVVAVASTAIGGNIGARGMKKRMGSVRTFEFRPLHNNRRVNLMISISGWMIGNEDDVRLPYSTVDPVEGDLYALHWEPEMLKSIGQTINIVANELFTQALQQILGATILTAFISAIQWPMGLSKLGYILDNPWSVSLDRAWAAGLILADTLISRNLGQRPITLMGFSLGSRVIFSCLVELSRKKALGLVENVYIFGTPVVKKKEHLVMARSAVSGRFVSAFSGRDWMLAYLFRAAAGGFSKVMGIAPIEGIENIENCDCTDIVDGHLAYRKNMPKLLKRLGIQVVSEEFVEIEETVDPEQLQRKRQMVQDVDAAQRKLQEKKHHSGWMPKWLKPKKSRWRAMVEDAVEEGKQIDLPESPEVSQAEEPKSKKKDSALVDNGALMRELQKIKAALREEELQQERRNDYDNDVKLNERNPEAEHSTQKEFSPPKTPVTTPRSPNNFQLLSAGRPILLEDDDFGKQKKDLKFSFSDDF